MATKALLFLKKNILLILIAIMIITFSIINKQSFIKTLPTLITLIVQILLVKADRKAFLLGGINSVFYAVAYALDGIYFSAIYAFLISTPMQIYAFFNWKQNSVENRAKLRVLGKAKLAATIIFILLGWMGVFFGLSQFFKDATLPLIDTLTFTLGIVCTFLTTFRYVDTQYISLINCILGLIMWIIITVENPASFNYVIISVYNCYRTAQATLSWTRQYLNDKRVTS